jgi:hypothetical protein
MAVPLTATDMQFLAALARSPFGENLRDVLRRRLADKDKACRTLDGPELYRAQGASQYIQQMLEELDEAQRKAQTHARPIRSVPHEGLA